MFHFPLVPWSAAERNGHNYGSKDQTEKNGREEVPLLPHCVADSRFPRDGRFIEEIGYYNPMEEPSVVKVDPEKAKKWLQNGAQPTDTVKALFKKHGVI